MKYSDEFAIASGQTGGNWDPIGGQSDYTRVSDTTETKDPTGITNHASKLTFNSGNATLRGYWYSGAVDGATTKTFSVYLKRATSNTTNIKIDIGDQGSTTYTITDEWKRYSVTTSSAGNGNFVDMRIETGASTPYYAWGAQIEAGAFPTSYIPTSSVAVTRYQDTMIMTGDDVTDVFNTTEGTMFYEASVTDLTNDNQPIVTFNDRSNAAGNEIAMGYRTGGGSSGNIRTWMRSYVTGSQVNSFLSNHASTGLVGGKPYKHIFGFKKDDAADSYNTGTNSAQTTDTSGNLPVAGSIDQLRFGSYYNESTISQYPLDSGHIKRFSYWPVRLTNAQLTTYIS